MIDRHCTSKVSTEYFDQSECSVTQLSGNLEYEKCRLAVLYLLYHLLRRLGCFDQSRTRIKFKNTIIINIFITSNFRQKAVERYIFHISTNSKFLYYTLKVRQELMITRCYRISIFYYPDFSIRIWHILKMWPHEYSLYFCLHVLLQQLISFNLEQQQRNPTAFGLSVWS